MLKPGDHPQPRRSAQRPPFPRILCAIDGTEGSAIAVDQALELGGDGARILFATAWSGHGSFEHAAVADERAHDLAERAAERARERGLEPTTRHFGRTTFDTALVPEMAWHDLLVVGAHPHGRTTGIVLGDVATRLVHRCPLPVLVARDHPLDAPIIAATRAVPADRVAVTAGARLAARSGAPLVIVHVREHDDAHREPELRAERRNARALVGRPIEGLELNGSAARVLVRVAEQQHAGLIVVGSEGKHGLPALRSVSERVAHNAPCSVLVMREPRR
jgi:nucleotide-binding universal stress UspA family protein